ncbi:MAG TPA: hypothetical protein DHV28_07860 [Ignavibacteriales bacterium]|nr:hypothetical protein [Ignavibacteriales bacterium]
MELLRYIAYASIVIWALIPIRQFGTRLFLFFLILALLDLSSFILLYVFKTKTEVIYLIGTTILLYPLLTELKNIYRFGVVWVLVAAAFIIFYYTSISPILFQMVIHLAILIYFLKVLVLYYGLNRNVLLFHCFLLAYEFSLILKFFVYWHELNLGLIYFYLTTIFQIGIGIFFLFINEKNSPFIKI